MVVIPTLVVSWSWCFAAMTTPRGPAGPLLVESGANEHICHPDFAKGISVEKECGIDIERCARQTVVIITGPNTSI